MKHLALCLALLTGLIFTGCSHISELTADNLQEKGPAVSYSVIYYIHADSDYLYHDPEGKPVQENSNVIATAFEVAEAARSGEVLIYHQRRERKLLGLFPRRNSRFYHYKNGQLINSIKYRHPDKKEAFLATEAQIMNQYRAHKRTDNHQIYFLYFGHEIPTEIDNKYHRSLPGIDVNIVSFANGIQNFLLSDHERFNLVVVSTCNNGTPAMAEILIPFTNTMLASPQNLHLSHFDSDKISYLEREPDIPPVELGRIMAEQTYQRLDSTVQTTITLALYDLKIVRTYINTLTSYIASESSSERFLRFHDNIDCAQYLSRDSARFRNGVTTWYKPSRFGRQSGQSTHSGWGCKPVLK